MPSCGASTEVTRPSARQTWRAAATTAAQTGATTAATLAGNETLAVLREQTAAQVRTGNLIASSADVTVRGITILGEIMAAGLQGVMGAIVGLPHASGGIAGGRAMINDAGPEIVELPTGSRVMTNRASMSFMRQLRREGGAGTADSGSVVAAVDRVADAVLDASDRQVSALEDVSARVARLERETAEVRRVAQSRVDLDLVG